MAAPRAGEFELIRRHFAGLTALDEDVVLGIGDDCALLALPPGQELAVTTDTLVDGRHFPHSALPADVGWKSLAVNLSDLAAMGADARWFTLALTLPEADERWLEGFVQGLGEAARAFGVSLVGGDTTRGPLSITITALGTLAAGQALRRSGAQAGDVICVTGTLGDAALGLRLGPGSGFLWNRLNRPTPRLKAGRALRGLAHAAIDLSDGLAGDLRHVLAASGGLGAIIHAGILPASAEFDRVAPVAERLALQVSGGDDYELCVCLPREQLLTAQRGLDLPLTEIGTVTEEPGLRFVVARGLEADAALAGYQHF